MCFGICTINICVSIRVRGLHLVFTHKDDCTQEPYTGELLHTRTSTQRSFYTEKSLYRGVFTPRRVDTQKLLHADAFTHRKKLITRKSFCARELLHKVDFTQSNFYTEKSLHREEAWPHRRFHPQHTNVFTHRSLYIEKPLHRGFFTHRSSCAQKLLRTFFPL